MEFEQFYLACLSHASYLVGDEGEAASSIRSATSTSTYEAARAKG